MEGVLYEDSYTSVMVSTAVMVGMVVEEVGIITEMDVTIMGMDMISVVVEMVIVDMV